MNANETVREALAQEGILVTEQDLIRATLSKQQGVAQRPLKDLAQANETSKSPIETATDWSSYGQRGLVSRGGCPGTRRRCAGSACIGGSGYTWLTAFAPRFGSVSDAGQSGCGRSTSGNGAIPGIAKIDRWPLLGQG